MCATNYTPKIYFSVTLYTYHILWYNADMAKNNTAFRKDDIDIVRSKESATVSVSNQTHTIVEKPRIEFLNGDSNELWFRVDVARLRATDIYVALEAAIKPPFVFHGLQHLQCRCSPLALARVTELLLGSGIEMQMIIAPPEDEVISFLKL